MIYVTGLQRAPSFPGFRSREQARMFSDKSRTELGRWAKRLGIPPGWLRSDEGGGFPHYVLNWRYRIEAINLGASIDPTPEAFQAARALRAHPALRKKRSAGKAEGKEYDIVYIDPPWRMEFSRTERRDYSAQYNTIPLDDLMRLKIPAAKNCVLYLWTTAPLTYSAMRLLDAWEFQYRTNMIWHKIGRLGMGNWFRCDHELLLVAAKGAPRCPKSATLKRSVLAMKPGKHSEKPSILYDWIDEWYPDARKLEIFARTERPGWDALGYGVGKEIELC